MRFVELELGERGRTVARRERMNFNHFFPLLSLVTQNIESMRSRDRERFFFIPSRNGNEFGHSRVEMENKQSLLRVVDICKSLIFKGFKLTSI